MRNSGEKGKRGKHSNKPKKLIIIDNNTGQSEETVHRIPRAWWQHHRSFSSADEIQELGLQYIEEWEAQNKPLTVVGLILYLGVNKSTFGRYLRGEMDEIDPLFSATCEKLKSYIEMAKFEKALSGLYVAPVAMFDLKFNHGYNENADAVKPVKKLADLDASDLTAEEAFIIWKEELKKIEK